MATVITNVFEYPEIQLSPSTKMIGRKCLIQEKEFLDLRLHIHYPNSEGYLRTKKGIFLEEKKWKEIVLPFLNSIFPSEPK